MTKTGTISEALGVEDRTEGQREQMARIVHDLTHSPNYSKADAILDLMKIYNIPDTPDARKIASEIYTFSVTAYIITEMFK